MQPAWPLIVSAAIYGLLGLVHAAYTFHDIWRRPRYFRPRDHELRHWHASRRNDELVAALRDTTVALAPGGHSFWTASLGFHLSHSIGVLLFALLILISGSTGTGWLLPLLIVISMIYALIAWRFWFHIPLMGCLLATASLIVGLLI